MIQGNEGNQNGSVLYVTLIFRIVTVVLVLTDFQTAGTTEGDVHTGHIPQNRNNPLTYPLIRTNTRNEAACPKDNFSQIIGTTDNLVQACVTEAMGILLL